MAKKSNFLQKNKRVEGKVQLTSLMDGLTIILIFLLTNYQDNPQEVEVPKFINLPKISGKNFTNVTPAIIVNISLNKIQLGKTAAGVFVNFNDYKSEIDQIVIDYKEKLEIEKKKVQESRRSLAGESSEKIATEEKIKLSIQADESVPFDFLDAIMFASNEVGLNYFDFVLDKVDE